MKKAPMLLTLAMLGIAATVLRAALPADYAGRPFQDAVHAGSPQQIPGPVFCSYYDSGGEGIAYHDTDSANNGSGKLNPANGLYLNEFRRDEGCDTSYTKPVPDRESPCNKVTPPLGLLYVGWNEPGEWFKLTVETAEAGIYVADVLYTSQRGGTIGVDVDGTASSTAFDLVSTFDPAETIPWRQWHHWNIAPDAFEVTLPKGVSVLTVRILTNGNLNLATFDFRLKGRQRTGPAITDVKTPSPTQAQLLVNGDFVDGITNWVVSESGATGEAAVVADGPGGKPALRLKVLTVGDQPWKLQVYQPGMRVEQGKEYVLTLWAKAGHAGEITVNCQQNHEPWEHHTQKKVPVTAEWQQVRFPFIAPWTDDKIRISFTDLGTTPDQVYWFAKCSLMPAHKGKTSAAAATAAAKPAVVLKQPSGTYSSPVAAHGALQVIGNHVCDAHGEPYQLRGMSLFWSHWSGRFYTKETVNVLAENWRCSVVRAATGAEPGEGGYLDNPTAAMAKLKAVVDAAIAKGIYVIIDWHKEHRVAAPSQVAEATAFFTQMATTYGSYPNVIFEIYNEPNGPQWPAVKAYAETVIGAIRKTGSTNLIIVGTPKWSQDVDIAAADPITDFKNIAYALHFYAGTPDHKPLRGKATAAMNKGIALFVTEWGTCDSSGNGGLDLPESVLWMNFLKENSISWANWSLHDKAETTSTLKPGTRVTGPPSGSDLTPSGVFVYNNLVAP